jgi:hypothetical protein
MFTYPKILKNLNRLSAFFGLSYGKEFEKIIAREPSFTYMAYLSQTGTDAPVPQVLFSNFENNPTFAYNAIGVYDMFHPLINSTKSIVSISSGQVVSPDSYRAVAYIRTSGNIVVNTIDITGSPSDDQLLNTLIKFEVWL